MQKEMLSIAEDYQPYQTDSPIWDGKLFSACKRIETKRKRMERRMTNKYNIGETVFYIYFGSEGITIQSMKITEIALTSSNVTHYNGKNGGWGYSEHKLFSTKKEAIDQVINKMKELEKEIEDAKRDVEHS